jgi:hypothetical protein
MSFLEQLVRDVARGAVEAAHDPATFDDPLDVSVRVRDILALLRGNTSPGSPYAFPGAADLIEQRAREGRL